MQPENTDLFGIIQPANPDPNPPPAEDDEKKIVSDCMDKYEEARMAKTQRQRLQEYYLLMLKGESLIAQAKNTPEVMRIVVNGDPRRTRSPDNMMRIFSRAFVAKLIKTISKARAVPRTNDRDDMTAAEVMDSFADYGWRAQKFRIKYKRALECIPWAGIGIHQLYWDPLGGEELAVCPNDKCGFVAREGEQKPGEACPACAAELQAPFDSMQQMPELSEMDQHLQELGQQHTPQLKKAMEGELKLRVVHPFEFFPDPGAPSIEEAQYVILSRIIPVSQCRREHPDKADMIHKEDGLYSEKYVTGLTGMGGARVQTVLLTNHVRKTEVYEMPTGEHPEGRIIYIANNRLLEIKDNVYGKLLGRPPFFVYSGDRDLGTIWGDELIGQAETQQRERDIATSQLRRMRELTANPQFTTTWNSGIDMKSMPTTAGLIIKVKPGGAIRPIQMPQIPPWFLQDLQRLKDAAKEKFGVTDYEMGQTLSGDSGRLMAFMDTAAQGVVAGMLVEIQEEWLELHRAWIVLGRYFYPKDRIWTIYGKDKVLSFSWQNANIKPGWDVVLEAEDCLSSNPVMRLQQAQQLQTSVGFFNDPQTKVFDRKEFMRMAHMNPDRIAPDVESAERVFAANLPDTIADALRRGQPGPVYQPQVYDDAWVFIEELQGWLKTKGRTSPPEVVQQVTQLYQQYAQAVMPLNPNQAIDPMQAKLLPNMRITGQGGPQPGQAGPQTGGAPPMPAQANVSQGVPTQAPTDAQQTGSNISQADKRGEQLARGAQKHEGTTV